MRLSVENGESLGRNCEKPRKAGDNLSENPLYIYVRRCLWIASASRWIPSPVGLELMPDNSGWLSSPLEDRDECSLVTICQSGTEAGIDWRERGRKVNCEYGQLVCGKPTKDRDDMTDVRRTDPLI